MSEAKAKPALEDLTGEDLANLPNTDCSFNEQTRLAAILRTDPRCAVKLHELETHRTPTPSQTPPLSCEELVCIVCDGLIEETSRDANASERHAVQKARQDGLMACSTAIRNPPTPKHLLQDLRPLRSESDIPRIGRGISQLIREIDTRYSRNAFDGVEELESILEELLESLDAALSEIEDESEWAPDLEPDPGEGCSIEEQFRRAYAQHFDNLLGFFPGAELAEHLRSVLEESQLGGMNPAGFLGAEDQALVELARELYWEQRQRIASLRPRASIARRYRPSAQLSGQDCTRT